MKELKKGDVVEVVKYKQDSNLRIGTQYIVQEINWVGNVKLQGHKGGYFPERFKLVRGAQVQGVEVKHTFLDDLDEVQFGINSATPQEWDIATENSGSNGNYYKLELVDGNLVECNDIIEALNMSYAEASAFKAVWRKAAARMGNGKENHKPLYDAQKVQWAGNRLVAQES